MDALTAHGKALVFACGHQEPLNQYPEILPLIELQGLEVYARRLHMPEGVDCSRCSPNTAEYWGMVCRLITANAGTDWPIGQRTLGAVQDRQSAI